MPLLDQVQIASPCDAPWEGMTGNELARRCARCDREVFNISAMSRQDAEAFLRERVAPDRERICGLFFRRSDGTIITADCPVGLAAIRRRARIVAARIAAALGLTVLTGVALESSAVPRVRSTNPFPQLIDSVWMMTAKIGLTKPRPPVPKEFWMGRILTPKPIESVGPANPASPPR